MSTLSYVCYNFKVKLDEEQQFDFCGNQPPPAIMSTGQSIDIHFTYQHSTTTTLTGRGFNASYTQVSRKYFIRPVAWSVAFLANSFVEKFPSSTDP